MVDGIEDYEPLFDALNGEPVTVLIGSRNYTLFDAAAVKNGVVLAYDERLDAILGPVNFSLREDQVSADNLLIDRENFTRDTAEMIKRAGGKINQVIVVYPTVLDSSYASGSRTDASEWEKAVFQGLTDSTIDQVRIVTPVSSPYRFWFETASDPIQGAKNSIPGLPDISFSRKKYEVTPDYSVGSVAFGPQNQKDSGGNFVYETLLTRNR